MYGSSDYAGARTPEIKMPAMLHQFVKAGNSKRAFAVRERPSLIPIAKHPASAWPWRRLSNARYPLMPDSTTPRIISFCAKKNTMSIGMTIKNDIAIIKGTSVL